MDRGNIYTLVIGILGAIKLILQAFGIDIITDDAIDAIANGVAAVVAIIAVLLHNHPKKKNFKKETPTT
jgi:uncharacterized membrane protein